MISKAEWSPWGGLSCSRLSVQETCCWHTITICLVKTAVLPAWLLLLELGAVAGALCRGLGFLYQNQVILVLRMGGCWRKGTGFLLLYLYCSLQICSRLPCTLISRTWKSVSRSMLKQLTVIRRNEKPASLAVWLYSLYPVQESSFAINQPFAEWLPFPLQVLLGCPQEQCAGRADGSSCCNSQPAVTEMHVQTALC